MPHPVFVNTGIEQILIYEAEFFLYVHFNFSIPAREANIKLATIDHCLGVNVIKGLLT